MNDGSVLKVSNTGTDNGKIRFNASLASCVSIESTHAPLLVYACPMSLTNGGIVFAQYELAMHTGRSRKEVSEDVASLSSQVLTALAYIGQVCWPNSQHTRSHV